MTLLKLHAEPLQEQWLDAYGHLNEAYYLVPFTNANWAIMAHFGIGTEYYERTGGAMYTVESHVRGADAKRLRVAHIMKVDGSERATFECVMLHFDSKAGRTAPMPAATQAALKAALPLELP